MSEWLDKRTRLRKKNLFSNSSAIVLKISPSWRWITRRILCGSRTCATNQSAFRYDGDGDNILMITGATPDSGKTFVSSLWQR